MPKVKTRKAASKRFKKTATGKLLYSKKGRRHIQTKKSPKRKRNLRRTGVAHESDARRLKYLLPYD